jgi:hypothetical protein
MGHKFLPVSEFVNIPTVGDALMLGGFLLWIAANFVFRSDILRYFNGIDPGRVRIGILQAFVWSALCFQYHFNRAQTPKKGGVTPPAG